MELFLNVIFANNAISCVFCIICNMVLKFKKLHFILINNWSVIITRQLLTFPVLTLKNKKEKISRRLAPPLSPPPCEIFHKNAMYKITPLERTGAASQYRSQWKITENCRPPSLPHLPSYPLLPLLPPSFLIVSWLGLGGGCMHRAMVTFQFTVSSPSFAHSISTLFIAS